MHHVVRSLVLLSLVLPAVARGDEPETCPKKNCPLTQALTASGCPKACAEAALAAENCCKNAAGEKACADGQCAKGDCAKACAANGKCAKTAVAAKACDGKKECATKTFTVSEYVAGESRDTTACAKGECCKTAVAKGACATDECPSACAGTKVASGCPASANAACAGGDGKSKKLRYTVVFANGHPAGAVWVNVHNINAGGCPQQRLHHLNVAVEHLQAAGLTEAAEEVHKVARDVRRDLLRVKLDQLARLRWEVKQLQSDECPLDEPATAKVPTDTPTK